MPTALYLVAPPEGGARGIVTLLRPVLAAAKIDALLLPRGARAEADYAALARAIVPLARQGGTAVLVEGEPALVRPLGADGLHVDGAVPELKAAIAALSPGHIVGASISGASRHEAMLKGEAEPDYIMFGPLSGPIDGNTRELARWWAETMEIPSVLSDPEARPEALETEGCEFLAVGESLWHAPAEAPARLAAIAGRLAER